MSGPSRRRQSKTDRRDSATDAGERKRRNTLVAHLALRGYELRELASGELLVTRWGLQRFCATLEAAEDFARQVGALR